MVKIIKKGGRIQAFNPAKIRNSISRAAKEAKVSSIKEKQLLKNVADPVINLTKKKKIVKSTDLRRSLLGRLERRAKTVSKAWKRFDRKNK